MSSQTSVTPAQGFKIRTLTGVQVLSTGAFVPEQVVTNEELREQVGCDPEWIVQRSGIHTRRVARPEQTTGFMALQAARQCLQRSQVDPQQIDLLLLATFTADKRLPATACQLQHALGLNCPAFDLQAACAGFMYALVTAAQFIKSGTARHVLVAAGDCITRFVDPRDPKTYPLFGDAAAAVLVGPGSGEQGFLAYTLGSDGSGAELIDQPMGGSLCPPSAEAIAQGKHFMRMDGRAVFKWAVRLLNDSILEVLQAAGVSKEEVDHLVLHQANARILDAAVEALGFDRRRLVLNLDRYGNTSAASIPLALDELATGGRVQRGQKLLLSGFGAGLVWGTALFSW